jgi:hypothetical protein
MSRYEHLLTTGQRRATFAVGLVFLAAAGGLAVVLARRWWPLWIVLALAGLHYWRAAWRGRVAAGEDAPAPRWLRDWVLQSRLFAWLVARWRPPAA